MRAYLRENARGHRTVRAGKSIAASMKVRLNPAGLDGNTMGAMNEHGDLTLKSCRAEDVANILLFFASDESKALTGQIVVSDFGVNL